MFIFKVEFFICIRVFFGLGLGFLGNNVFEVFSGYLF